MLDDAAASAFVVGERWTEVAEEALARASRDVGVRIAATAQPPAGFEAYEDVLAVGFARPPRGRRAGRRDVLHVGHDGPPQGRARRPGARSAARRRSGCSSPPGSARSSAPPSGCVQLVCGPIYHSAQWVFCVMPLLQGATVVLQHTFDAAGVLDLIDRHGVTNTHLVPAQFVRLLRLPDEVRRGLRGLDAAAGPPRRRAVPAGREAPGARVVGPDRHRVLRRHRGRLPHRHHRRGVARAARQRGPAAAARRDRRGRRRRRPPRCRAGR